MVINVSFLVFQSLARLLYQAASDHGDVNPGKIYDILSVTWEDVKHEEVLEDVEGEEDVLPPVEPTVQPGSSQSLPSNPSGKHTSQWTYLDSIFDVIKLHFFLGNVLCAHT